MNMRKIYRQIAKEHGVTVAEVKRDMQEAISAAYQNPPDDGGVTAAWQRQVPHREETPTPEEVIRYASAKEKKEQSNH